PKMSPDFRQVVYIWENGNRYQLRVMANETGAKPRVLITDNVESEYSYYEPSAWSPDSKSILAVLWKKDATAQLAWVSAADGKVQVLRSLQWRIREFSRPRLSADGKYIAYSALERSANSSAAAEASTAPRQIYILAADGSTETALTKTGVNEAPIW